MGLKVKGISNAKKNLNDLINDVKGRKAVRAIQSALILGSSRAAYYTPIDTSTLINSQFREVDFNGVQITGRVGYSANYAAYVHEMPGTLKGQPRAHFGVTSNHSDLGPQKPKEFGGGTKKGNYWDPHAEPHFLSKGFDEEQDAISAVIRKEMSL
ncbi:HK97 gp10 family phage protein [Hafnia paralvei]|uniref:HK97 gp10 family phage protein n=1 Tax=Hafnia paralvei TaxID=546367 RepID=UPI000DF11359|nr:HK97 gp10 family phage protein [Hafnia paralvei]RDA68353.1 HK97 gp10 family phage protein [Hafnia paralvei]RDA69392.1 HK97 gp10 family phage protein [Hafnia paralvei]RDA69553.1 HK97 gp10 family phage protein [Hafnia paralvei]RDA79596.1 HK97 gp10 family phage protein [Hafnia paralvei]RDA80133.1 HK97 gp10 family phage protein [Hafnia paralvei]